MASVGASIRVIFSGRAVRSVCHLSFNCQDFTVNEALEFFMIILESETWILETFALIGLVRLCFVSTLSMSLLMQTLAQSDLR